MNEQEKKLFEMYGKKPAKNVLSNMQKVSPAACLPLAALRTFCRAHACPPAPVLPLTDPRRGHHQERKYFDSGDYAMHKAGMPSDVGGAPLAVGKAIPTPEGCVHGLRAPAWLPVLTR